VSNNTRKVLGAISCSARGLILLGLLLPGGAAQSGVSISGSVLDENHAPVADATVRFRRASNPTERLETDTGPGGAFSLQLPENGPYRVTVTHAGFHPLLEQAIEIQPDTPAIHLVLNHIDVVLESIDVSSEPPQIDVAQTQAQTSVSALDLINIPYEGRDVTGALRLLPGVVQDPLGTLHLTGGSVNQVHYTLDGFNITDPITGQLNTRLNVDSVRSIDYAEGRYSAESGKGSAGTVAIATGMGTDRLYYNVTNFVPGIDTASGLHIGTWAPRVMFSGPLFKGKAWFSESAQATYSQAVITDVAGNNKIPTLQIDNLLRVQANLTPTDILFASFLMNRTSVAGSGLSALDPYSTTVDRRWRAWFYSVKHDKSLPGGALLEWGYAEHRTISRQIPQGDGLYLITPYGRQGNFYVNSTESGSRRQFMASLAPRTRHKYGPHQIKFGVDLDRLDYRARSRRTGYEDYGLNGLRFNLVDFAGTAAFDRPSLEAAAWVQDKWRPRPWLSVEAGLRMDWDELLRNAAFSPRLSASAAPFGWKNAKITAGYAITRDATSLQLFARPLDQIAATTTYNPDGTVAAGPIYTYFTIPAQHWKTPLYSNWTGGVERLIAQNTTLSVNLLRKRGVNGLSYLVNPDPRYTGIATIFELENHRRDVIDSAVITVRQHFGKDYEWMASYTRSRALSNDVVDLSLDSPVWVTNNIGRMPWDSPNHVLAYAYLPTRWSAWAVSCLAEARNGFPFSLQTDTGNTVGAVNSHRYPAYLDLDLHLEHKFRLAGRRVALRGGFNNITNHRNPTTVNNVIGAPEFMQFYGSPGRHVVFRFRWLGESTK
jgi:hypothetical protein